MRLWRKFCHLIFFVQQDTFQLTKEFIPLNQLIKLLGWTETGGQSHELIDHGFVLVNGVVETQRRKKIVKGMVIQIEDQKVVIE